MKGLLLKDWYLTLKYARFLMLFAVIYGVAGVFRQDFAAFSILPVMMIALLPQTLVSYDEREKWTVYAQALPVSRAQYVTEKYLFGACCYAVYLAVLALLHLAAGTEDYGTLFAMQFSIGLLAPSVLLPLLFRFGSEKGRMAYLIVIAAFFGAAMVLMQGASLVGRGGVTAIVSGALPALVLCPIMVAVYVLSWRIAIAMYQKREL